MNDPREEGRQPDEAGGQRRIRLNNLRASPHSLLPEHTGRHPEEERIRRERPYPDNRCPGRGPGDRSRHRAGGGVSREAGQPSRGLRRRRADGHYRARPAREAGREAGHAGGRPEQTGLRRPGGRRIRRQVQGGRLQHLGPEPVTPPAASHRRENARGHVEGLRAHHHLRQPAHRVRHQRGLAVQDHRADDRLRPEESREAYLRPLGDRGHQPSVRRAVPATHEDPAQGRSLCRGGPP